MSRIINQPFIQQICIECQLYISFLLSAEDTNGSEKQPKFLPLWSLKAGDDV